MSFAYSNCSKRIYNRANCKMYFLIRKLSSAENLPLEFESMKTNLDFNTIKNFQLVIREIVQRS